MSLSQNMIEAVKGSSGVRKMFEEGLKLKARYGPDKVFDFSLGNPDLRPPARLGPALSDLLRRSEGEGHGYMPNAGLIPARQAVARRLERVARDRMTNAIKPEMVILTVGAAGAMNVFLKTILEPGDNVVVLAPYFMEYNFYVRNHGGVVKVAQTNQDFRLDAALLSEAIDRKTRAVIINTPNNPTGAVYTSYELMEVAELLERRLHVYDRPVYLIVDEPYREICFEGGEPPLVFEHYRDSVIVSSFSKSLSIPGERLGYLCFNPRMRDWKEMADAATVANRILGFVNAPALFQRVLPEIIDSTADVEVYRRRVALMTKGLTELGYKVPKSQGTFYLFPKSPLADDKAFVNRLKDELILAVPGSAFGREGYFRLSLCVNERRISDSLN